MWADSGYAGKHVAWAKKHKALTVQIVKRTAEMTGFVVLPRSAPSSMITRRYTASQIPERPTDRAGALVTAFSAEKDRRELPKYLSSLTDCQVCPG